MIRTKQDLYEYIMSDNVMYRSRTLKYKLISRFCHYTSYELERYLYNLRKQEYYINTANGNKVKGILGLYYERKVNKLGNRLGIEIGPNCFGKGLSVYHIGSIIINPAVKAGDNCKLHGANCIGNNGKTQGVPRIGNNVDIGYGAVVIGDIEIADDVVIGANAVINKSVLVPGSVVVGIPGNTIKFNQSEE